MLKPHFMNDDIPYIYLPFVKDTIDMTQTQQLVDADIQRKIEELIKSVSAVVHNDTAARELLA